MKKHQVTERVRYFETDRMKVAHHTAYMVWFEVGRTSLMEEVGFPYREMEERGYFLPVVEFSCRLKAGADYGDTVKIETWVERLRTRSVTFGYLATRDGVELAQGWTKHLCVDKINRSRKLPAGIIEALLPYAEITIAGKAAK